MPYNVRFPKSNPDLDDVNTRQNVSNIIYFQKNISIIWTKITCDGSLIAKILFKFKEMLMSNPVPSEFLPYMSAGTGGSWCLL